MMSLDMEEKREFLVVARSAMILPILLVLLPSAILHARIIRVPGDSPTIQGGINMAADGDTVLIAPGTYPEGAIDFLGKAIVVTGTNPEDTTVVAATIVDGSGLRQTFYFHSGETSSSMLAGLTIIHPMPGGYLEGFGIECVNASPTITHNIIRNNYLRGIICDDSSPIITRNTIKGNPMGISCLGSKSRPIIYNNLIEDNGSDSGIGIDDSSPLIANNLIRDNYSGMTFYYGNQPGSGGGIKCTGGTPVIVNNVIRDNQVRGGGFGAGLYFSGTTAILANNIIAGNYAYDWWDPYHRELAYGGGIYANLSLLNLSNNTITGNTAEGWGGGLYCQSTSPPGMPGSEVTVVNTVLWNNTAEAGPEIALGHQSDLNSTSLDINYSDVAGGKEQLHIRGEYYLNWGSGMIDADPLFVMPENGDYRLLWGSPCIDTGHPDSLDADMSRRDMGAFYYDQNELVTLYLTPDATEVRRGDSLGVTYTLINRWAQPQTFFLETDVILPGGRKDPLFGPDEYTLPGGTTDQFRLAHGVPANAPRGWYGYWSRTLFPLAAIPGEDRFTFRVIE